MPLLETLASGFNWASKTWDPLSTPEDILKSTPSGEYNEIIFTGHVPGVDSSVEVLGIVFTCDKDQDWTHSNILQLSEELRRCLNLGGVDHIDALIEKVSQGFPCFQFEAQGIVGILIGIRNTNIEKQFSKVINCLNCVVLRDFSTVSEFWTKI